MRFCDFAGIPLKVVRAGMEIFGGININFLENEF